MGRREQAAASRDALIAAALDCFGRCGYDATTVAQILQRTGMARGALYHYFPDGKAGIFAAAYRRVDDLLHAELDRIAGAGSRLDAVRAGLAVYLWFCTQDEYGRITILDAPHVIPGQQWTRPVDAGRAFGRLRNELAAAQAAHEISLPDVDMAAVAVYGAAQELGARIFADADRETALAAATVAIDLVVDGFARTARRPSEGDTTTTAAAAPTPHHRRMKGLR